MNDDYLWDRSGTPDPEIVRLEQTLGGLRYTRPLAIPEPRRTVFVRHWGAAAAAAVLVIGFAIWQVSRPFPAAPTQWELAGGTKLRTGQTIETKNSSARLFHGKVGMIDLAPASELRVVESKAGRERFHFQRGAMHAVIWAPPGEFLVDTPSSRAVDLGCEYELSIDENGDGLLRVSLGWVAFQSGRLESFIPEEAACRTRRATGPGIPWFEDASEQLKTALLAFENSGDPQALDTVLGEARKRDALTLWHLLSRTPPAKRGVVFDQFSRLVPLPVEVTRAGIIRNDPAMLDRSWNALGLENTAWWRQWKQKW